MILDNLVLLQQLPSLVWELQESRHRLLDATRVHHHLWSRFFALSL